MLNVKNHSEVDYDNIIMCLRIHQKHRRYMYYNISKIERFKLVNNTNKYSDLLHFKLNISEKE